MAVSMENDPETIESFLQSLGLETFITLFKVNDVDLNLLLDLSDLELKAILVEMKLPIGSQYKIMQKIRKMKDNDVLSNVIQLVNNGKEVCIQIGHHNVCHLNIEISDKLQNDEESNGTSDEGGLVKMTLNMHTASSPGVYVAYLEERIFQTLSGDQRKEINKVLQEKFGVEIVACRKGSVVLVLRKMKPIANGLVYKNVQLDFLSTLFKLLGFSNESPSKIDILVKLTSEDDTFNESQLKKTGLQLILSPRNTIACMAKEDQKKLVSWLFLKTTGPNLRDNNNSELQVEAHFRNKVPNHTEDYKVLEKS